MNVALEDVLLSLRTIKNTICGNQCPGMREVSSLSGMNQLQTSEIHLYSDIGGLSDNAVMSEEVLKVGKRGEIFTSKELRVEAKIRVGGRVKARMVDDKLVIESIPSIEELLSHPVLTISARKAERLSEEAQREEGIYG